MERFPEKEDGSWAVKEENLQAALCGLCLLSGAVPKEGAGGAVSRALDGHSALAARRL